MKNYINKKSKIYKFKNLLNIINNDLKLNKINSALKHLKNALDLEPKNHLILNEIGNCFAKINDYSSALDYHNKAVAIDSNNAIILCNVGIDLFKLDRLKEAIQFFEFSIECDNNYYMAYNGLATAYHSTGDINNLYKLSIKAITLFPNKYDFHLNLGISLIYLEKFEEALYSIETAIILEPNSIEAKINKAAAFSKMGKHEFSIKIYEDILNENNIKENTITNSVKFNLAFEYLFQGEIIKGWSFYDYGFEESIPFNQRRKPNRIFKSPKWEGQFSKQKTLMVWREQGLGDEILFLSLIPDLLGKFNNLIIECDPRLINIIKFSYPEITVREPIYLEHEDYDIQIPMGSISRYLRNKIEDFTNKNSWLKAKTCEDKEIANYFINQSQKILIGICWRSGLLNQQRNNNYIPLNDWDSIFKIPNAEFINLQYGDCESELVEAEEKFNIKIMRWKHIDLKNNLDLVFNIINSLDFLVTAATAVSSMGYSIGKTTLVFQPHRNWTNLGTDYYPWSQYMHQFIPKGNDPIATALLDISKYIISSKN
jgi:tetratricopeptide (TPR) repeat protein